MRGSGQAHHSHLALDLDGVVYRGMDPVDGAIESIDRLRSAGVTVTFATNNSGSTAEQIADKLNRLGVTCIDSDVVTSAQAAAHLALGLTGRGSPILAVGAQGLLTELARAGLALTDDALEAEAVVVGLASDPSSGSVDRAVRALRRDVPFIGCNRDLQFPGPGGRLLPGCGPFLAAIEAAAGRTANRIAGKPEPHMLHILASRFGVDLEAWFVVGDSDVDIAMARNAGVPGYLVAHHASPYRDLKSLTSHWISARAEPTAGIFDQDRDRPTGRSTDLREST